MTSAMEIGEKEKMNKVDLLDEPSQRTCSIIGIISSFCEVFGEKRGKLSNEKRKQRMKKS